jgi:Zn-dependent protease with chaperone function
VTARRFAALVLLLSGCAVPPPSPRAPLSTRSAPSIDEEMAQESHRLQQRAELHFAEQKRRVERVGKRLLETIPGHPNVQFVVVNGDPSINAGATFGQVAITSGMLNFLQSDDEMAVVLGHELAHIEQGHVLKGTVSSLALNILATVLEARAPGAGQAAGGIGQLFLNHYTQTQEREADEVGLRYAYEAGYDPRVAAGIQERMAVEVPQSMSAGYFDTHPSSVERAVSARREAEDLLARGEPPGRAEVLALERADEGALRARRESASAVVGRPRPHTVDGAPSPSDSSAAGVSPDGCRRASVYVDMARDSHDPAEREDLYRRALRYCPTLAEARSGLEQKGSAPAGDDRDVPLDTY